MRELFLTASVKDDDLKMACAVLQGLTWMTARRSLHRILFFHGQPQPRHLKNTRAFQQSRYPNLWRELSNQLVRSSYILQTAYEVNLDKDFGKGTVMEFDSLPGTLRWTDFPDPPRDSPFTSRKKIEIPEQINLPMAMNDNGFRYKNEVIQESYSFIRDNVEFVFSRYYYLAKSPGRPVTSIPNWTDLRPIDPAQNWVLNVKLNAPDDSQPEKIRKAGEELLAVKEELDKLFEFRVIDRKVFDTRITPPPVTVLGGGGARYAPN